jgi:hypothetical protein
LRIPDNFISNFEDCIPGCTTSTTTTPPPTTTSTTTTSGPCLGRPCIYSAITGPDEIYQSCFGAFGPTQYRVNGGNCEAYALQLLCKDSEDNIIGISNPGSGNIVNGGSQTIYGNVDPCLHIECSGLC